MSRFVILGNPDGRRIALFQEALAALGRSPAVVVPWLDALKGVVTLDQVLRDGDLLRIESPGKNWPVEKALLTLGAEKAAREPFTSLSPEECDRLEFDKGEIHCPRQWYLGFREALRRVEWQRRVSAPHRCTNEPSDLVTVFDKPECHHRLLDAGVAVPPSLGVPTDFNDLLRRMKDSGTDRVFAKPAHASSASGIVALRRSGSRISATTTTEVVENPNSIRLFNTRNVRRLTDEREIALLIDALCRHRMHVETWVPKAGLPGGTFDLRLLVIAGDLRHALVRMSRGPITNLHLGGTRAALSTVRARLDEATWQRLESTCERVARCYPGLLHAGLDVAIGPGFRRFWLLEVNGFGDLLPGCLDRGEDTYTAEIRACLTGAEACPRVFERTRPCSMLVPA